MASTSKERGVTAKVVCLPGAGNSLRSKNSAKMADTTSTHPSLYSFFFFLKKRCIYLGCAVSSRCCVRAFSICSQRGFSCCGAWALGVLASVVVALRLSCSIACVIFPDQGSNLCPLNWQADSHPLSHQGSPPAPLIEETVFSFFRFFPSLS